MSWNDLNENESNNSGGSRGLDPAPAPAVDKSTAVVHSNHPYGIVDSATDSPSKYKNGLNSNSNAQYGRNAFAQGLSALSFSNFVQQARSPPIDTNDANHVNHVHVNNGYDDSQIRTQRFNAGTLGTDGSRSESNGAKSPSKEQQKQQQQPREDATLSGAGKWRSARAQKLRQNPHQQHPFSSKPIQSQTQPQTHSDAMQPMHAQPDSSIASNTVSPTTYNNSRFTNFVIEEQQHTAETAETDRTPKQHDDVEEHDAHAMMAEPGPDGREQWYYKDPSGQEQGPFDKEQMAQWFGDGYFPQDLPIRCNEATPFVQLKDWFCQAMPAFLTEIPKVWPQTEAIVLINPTPHDAPVTVNTPPSSAEQLSHPHTHSSHKEQRYRDENVTGNGTTKSSVRGGTGTDGTGDSFYDANSNQGADHTRMASIHPRPANELEPRSAARAPATVTVQQLVAESGTMNPDEAMNFWVASGSPSDERPAQGGADGSYAYEDQNQQPQQRNEQPYFQDAQDREAGDYAYDDEDGRDTPPPAAPNAPYAQHAPMRSTSKLTSSAYKDNTIAATPPSGIPAISQHDHELRYHEPLYANGQSQSLQEAQPQTDYAHPHESQYVQNRDELSADAQPLFRSRTEPTAYHDQQQQQQPRIPSIGDIQRRRSDPEPESHNQSQSPSKAKGVYDPFGAQDLFANGRRNLTATTQQQSPLKYQHDQHTEHESNGKFSGDRHTHSLQQGQAHRKYAHGPTHPTRQPLKHSADSHNANGQNQSQLNVGSLGLGMGLGLGLSHESASSSSSTTPHKQRDRKPPIRHKWAHREYTSHFERVIGSGSRGVQPLPTEQEPPLPAQHNPDRDYAATKPPHHSHRYNESYAQHNEASLAIPVPIAMQRDQRDQRTLPTMDAESVTVSELFGRDSHHTTSLPSVPSSPQQALAPQQQQQVVAGSGANKKRKRRKKRTKKQDAQAPAQANCNVWGGHTAVTAQSGASFHELQAEDQLRHHHQQVQQQHQPRAPMQMQQQQQPMHNVMPMQPMAAPMQAQAHVQMQSMHTQPMSAMLKEQELYTPSYTQLPVQQQQPQQPQGNGKAPKAKKGKKGKAKAPKVSSAQMSNGGHGSSSSWSTRAAVSQSNGQRPANAKTTGNKANGKAKHNAKSGSSVSPSASKRAKGKSSKAAKSGKQRGGKQQQSGKAMMHQQNNRNIEAVNSVSPELQQWLRTEIKKLNPDVEAASVAHLLLTLDDDTVKTTANHTFGSSGEVKTFVDSFLVHRSHDLAQQKNKTAKGNAGKKHGQGKRKNKSRR